MHVTTFCMSHTGQYLHAVRHLTVPCPAHQPAPACRWFSSILLHTSFQHVLSNMLLFVVLSWQIEEKYGMIRVAFIFFWSAIGGILHMPVLASPSLTLPLLLPLALPLTPSSY